ncbi:BglII/BstYI family type II restriction endonuclease [Bacillus sp. AK128]
MKYQTHSFRYGEELFSKEEEFNREWTDIKNALDSITEEDLITHFKNNLRSTKKSISESINYLIDERLVSMGWNRQSPIFNSSSYKPTGKSHWWTLDFAKVNISVEVAFNHGEAVAWNLIKPVLASELNHVEKKVQTKGGVIITATKKLKIAGNFDSSTGTYEKFLQYLDPFRNILTVPIVIIGLEAPETFKVNKKSKKVEYIQQSLF